MSELKYWIWLSRLRGLNCQTIRKVLEYFGSPEQVYFAREGDYRQLLSGNIGPLLNKNLDEARRILLQCDELGITIYTLGDAAYPTRLKNIYNPPIVFYVKGRLPVIDEEAAVVLVGTRSCTRYGLFMAERLGYEIARAGGLVLTGLAAGVDSAAARGALRGQGRVVGFLGCGIDQVYPSFNGPLYDDVSAVGALVSEYPPGVRPDRTFFPARNRIMSGMSIAVTVVEAPRRSGALITADLALEQGREVFAVPGNVDSPASEGTNNLLQEGASVARSGQDILRPFRDQFVLRLEEGDRRELVPLDPELREKLADSQEKSQENGKTSVNPPKKAIDNKEQLDYILISCADLTEEQRTVLAAMTERLHVDEIIERSKLSASEVLSALTMLEIEGAVSQEPGKYFVPHFKITD